MASLSTPRAADCRALCRLGRFGGRRPSAAADRSDAADDPDAAGLASCAATSAGPPRSGAPVPCATGRAYGSADLAPSPGGRKRERRDILCRRRLAKHEPRCRSGEVELRRRQGLQAALLEGLGLTNRSQAKPPNDADVLSHETRDRGVRRLSGRTGLPTDRSLPRRGTAWGEPRALPRAHRSPRPRPGDVPDQGSNAAARALGREYQDRRRRTPREAGDRVCQGR